MVAQLGVLAALDLAAHPPAVAALPWLVDTLPELASLLAFELHATQQQQPQGRGAAPTLSVRLVVQQVQKRFCGLVHCCCRLVAFGSFTCKLCVNGQGSL
jgi:hypothetical protein